MSNSKKTYELGQSLWYDNIERRLLENGELEKMIKEGLIYGVTSNPSIFNNAIAKSVDYDDDLIPLAKEGKTANEIYETLAVEDIQGAADLFADVYSSTNGVDGYVSLEVDPKLANDTDATCDEAQRLWELVDRPNLMVKIPATVEGIPAIERSIANGLNINVTLIFSRSRYKAVIEAYFAGLEKRVDNGEPINGIASVASFFVSRIDSKVDKLLEQHIANNPGDNGTANKLKGKIAIANAKLAYKLFQDQINSDRFKGLAKNGARVQRPLWASTSTKNPAYSDVLYINELIGAETVNTVPPHTLDAFNDHGRAAITLNQELAAAEKGLEDLEGLGISLDAATQELETEGVKSFADAFENLIHAVEGKSLELTN